MAEPRGIAQGKTARSKAPKARILVVDDDERNLMALSEVLKGLAQVVTAPSGREALRHLLKGDFAVILLDVFMPGMDGYETASLIRERDQTSGIPIIFLSAVNKETEHLMRGYAMGAVDYVFKPVEPLILQSKVGVFVDLYNARVQVEETNRAEQQLRDANFKAELDRLQIARELQATRERQAVLLESLPIALYEASIDEAGRMSRKFVGGDLAKLTGLDAETLGPHQLDWDAHIHPEDAERIILPGLNGTRQLSMEYRWSGADKRTRHFLDQCVRIDDGTSLGRWAGTLIDITEQKQLEAQLLHSRKMDAIGQLTGGVAHDFNNLLSAVLGGLHLLEKRLPLADREKELVNQMRHAAEQGAELVRRMMAFARKQELSPSSVDPQSLCTTVAGLVEHTLGGTVKVEWSCAKTKHNLFVDRSQLELALVNLIINARDAMPQGGQVEVEIRDVDLDDVPAGLGLLPGSYLVICVRDQGEGIPDEIVSRVTEPFFTTKEAGKGTGLGLSMVVGFVQQSGGKLRIESTPGEGSTIEVYLPSTPQPALDQKPRTKARPAPRSVSKAILLVDDDDAVRAILGEQLRELGLRVDAVPNGSSAVERLKQRGRQYDVLLTDFAMPGINGLETISLARVEQPELHALLMTGFADEDAVASARSHVPVIRKPIDLEELMRQIG
jgi:signal transduction histidine kinase/ActR/RegA family two-component response regulator